MKNERSWVSTIFQFFCLTEVKKNPKLITLSHNDFNSIIKVYSKDYQFFTHPVSPQVGENNL